MINEQLYFNAYNEQVLASEKPKTIFKKIIEYIIYIWSISKIITILIGIILLCCVLLRIYVLYRSCRCM